MIDRDELSAWLRLLETPGVGRESARKLLAALRLAEAAIAASTRRPQGRRRRRPAGALAQSRPSISSAPGGGLAWLDEAARSRATSSRSAIRAIPDALLDSADPPLLLYARGRIELLQAPAIADRRQPQPDAARARERARVRGAPEPRRLGRRLGPGARHRRRGARGRACRRRRHDRGRRHRPRPRLSGAPSRARAADRRRRIDASASSRSARRRCRRTSRSAIASSPAWRAARWWSRRPCSRAR